MKRVVSLLVLSLSLFLEGCRHEGEDNPRPFCAVPAKFVDYPILLNVKGFGIVNSYSAISPLDQQRPRLFPGSLVSELSDWATKKFVPDGTQGGILFRIIDARVSEEGLDIFSEESLEKRRTLGINVIVSLQFSGKYYDRKRIQLRVSQEAYLTKEDLGEERRKEIWARLVNEVISELSQQMELRIREHYPRVVLSHARTGVNCG